MPLTIDETSQNSILGLMILNQDVTTQGLIAAKRGIYYSRIFQKPSNHAWYQINMKSNESSDNFQNIDVDIRYRSGNLLPIENYNTIPQTRYSFDGFNEFIKNNDPSLVDQKIYRWSLGRSLLGETQPQLPVGLTGVTVAVNSDSNQMIELGTATNTSQLMAADEPVWNYWSIPNLNKKFYIANNADYNYLQLRIDMTSLDRISPIEVYKITLSSLLKKESNP